MKTPCPYCAQQSTWLYKAKDLNRKVSEKSFDYYRCQSCELIFISQIPADLGKYYEEEYYAIPSLERLTKIARANDFKISTVKKFISAGHLLEIGPAYGVFAYQAKQAGFEVDVIEMDVRCCEYLNNVIGVNAVNSANPSEAIRGLANHDVIALWHVIEHLPEPWKLMQNAAHNLNEGGYLIIAAPNPSAWQYGLMGAQWPHVDAPRHLYLLPSKMLIDYAHTLGLKVAALTTSDSDAASWNRFGWQRYLMNRFHSKFMQRVAFVMGYLISLPMALFERRGLRGSAYTLVLQKVK